MDIKNDYYNLRIPKSRHLDYLKFLDKKCSSLEIGYALASSIVNGKANAYSDKLYSVNKDRAR